MRFTHKTTIIPLNKQAEVPDTAIVAGTHMESDGKGGWQVVVHLLERIDMPAMSALNGEAQFRQ